LAAKEHLHEYDDKWKCKCGQKLVVDTVEGKIKVKGFMTPNGQFVQLSQQPKEEDGRKISRQKSQQKKNSNYASQKGKKGKN
jgi:hypothetical protein